ncbi:MAG: tRNA (guanosine(37)-N1)-methyltransferase TrmD [candidate division WOR-3 bacterium]
MSLSGSIMRIDIITLFPEVFEPYFKSSILKRAQEKGLLKIHLHNLRDYAKDRHKTVDDAPFGGGGGMVLKIEPVAAALEKIKIKNEKLKVKVIATSTRGEKFDQKKALEYSKLDQLIIICGRYEAIDERVLDYYCDETISVGPYILTGGELPAMIIVDATARLIPKVLGNEQSLKNDFKKSPYEAISFPQYTRPEVFLTAEGKKLKVPKVLLSGNHKQIKAWRVKKMKKIN